MLTIDSQTILIRLLLSFLVGALIGYTRQRAGQSAGMRTHIVVSLGATIITLIGLGISTESIIWANANPDHAHLIRIDFTRLAGQVITGVSFLGAGTIVLNKERKSVSGLTTAATIWTVAGLGLAIGYGFFYITGYGTLLLFITLVALRRFGRPKRYTLHIHFDHQRSKMRDLFKLLDNLDLEVQDIEFNQDKEFAYIFELKGDADRIQPAELTQAILEEVSHVTYINIT